MCMLYIRDPTTTDTFCCYITSNTTHGAPASSITHVGVHKVWGETARRTLRHDDKKKSLEAMMRGECNDKPISPS